MKLKLKDTVVMRQGDQVTCVMGRDEQGRRVTLSQEIAEPGGIPEDPEAVVPVEYEWVLTIEGEPEQKPKLRKCEVPESP